jgi:preprotein translocase subunit YajC
MFELLAQTTTSQPSALTGLLPIVLIVGVGYFLMIRPQQRKMRQQREVLNAIEVGDDIVTAAGILGTIVDIDEDTDVITVEIAEGTQIRMLRGGISRRIADEDDDDYDEDEEEHETGGDEADGGEPLTTS